VIGFALRQHKGFPHETGNVLNLFVIYVSLPAVIMLKIPHLTLSSNILVPLLLPWWMLLLSALSVLLLSRLLGWSRSVTGCLMLVIPLGNTSFFGYPMVNTFFGSSGMPYAILYDQLGTFIALVTYGSFVLAIYGIHGAKPTTSMLARKIILFPPFLASVFALGLSMSNTSYPVFLEGLLESLAITLVPTVMIAVGFQISFRMVRSERVPLLSGLALKLIVAPFSALIFFKLFEMNGESINVAIFQAGMPPMVTAGALAIKENLAPQLAAALVGLGILVSCLSLPLLFSFF